MTTLSKVFSAAGQTSPVLLLKPGQSATWAVTTVFVATVVLQKNTSGDNWETVTSITSATDSGTILGVDRETRFRWLCSAYTSDSPTVTLVTRADVLREVVNADGAVVFRITDDGIEAPTVKAVGAGATPLETVSVSTLLTVAGLLSLGAPENTLTAHAGGTQAAALALSASVSVHRVTVCATNADSVKLPAPSVAGELHVIANDGAATLQVYGSGTDTINGVATATGVAVATGKRAIFIALATGAASNWIMLLSA